ncbi:EamA family transporter [Terriglobus roseus]|uniref:Putative transmembrane family 234 n=1 Tax=Terriglobus roseus TaxID=392734 RepID=A0A1H4IUF8_9BACT|nr:EamA family transporter [Terriglobus roseus]SEB36938.1 Putative transmembrane family 234 [Terriglobus roseus]
MIAHLSSDTIITIVIMVLGATVGETLISAAMTRVGDLDEIRAHSGLFGAIKAVVTSPFLIAGIACMAISFFALLFALSGADLSLVAPATNSLTFIATAIAAKLFLKENVDRRRWFAAIFVSAGVFLLTR